MGDLNNAMGMGQVFSYQSIDIRSVGWSRFLTNLQHSESFLSVQAKLEAPGDGFEPPTCKIISPAALSLS